MTFLDIVTRHLATRPDLLAANQASLDRQTSDDWTQTLLIDDVGRGVDWAQAQLAGYDPVGQYVWVLDDDDECARDTLVADLKRIAAEHDPDVIMVRMDYLDKGLLPEDAHWGQPPRLGHVGVCSIVVRRDVWLQHRAAWKPGYYDSDHRFIDAVWQAGPAVYWHDVTAARISRVSRGAGE